jgi:CshA-type fibril repeat protein
MTFDFYVLLNRWRCQWIVPVYLLLVLSTTKTLAQNPTPFSCSTGLAYLLTNPTTNANGNVTSLYSFNLSTGAATLIKDGVLPEPNRFLNGFGYNVVDNFIYGYRYNTNQIVRLGSNGDVETLPVVGLATNGSYATGDVSPNGVLYLFGSNSVVSVDLRNPISSLIAVPRLSGSTATSALSGLNDWAFSPIDSKIYGVTTNKALVSYDPVTNVATRIGSVAGLENQGGSFGAIFMDGTGNMYIGNNTSGNIYRLATPHLATGNVTATFFSNSLAGRNPGDGARCPNQIIPPSAANDLVCVATASSTASVSVTANDGAGSYAINPASVRLVDPISGVSVTSITITGQGTYSVNTSTGVVTFTPQAAYVRSTISYVVSDTQGNFSSPATLTVICSGCQLCPPVGLRKIAR